MTLFIARPWTITNLDKPVGDLRLTTVFDQFFSSLIVGTDGPLTIILLLNSSHSHYNFGISSLKLYECSAKELQYVSF